MRNTYTAAARAAHAPGDDTLARALKEALNSRALRARPSGHKCIDPARCGGGNYSGHRASFRFAGVVSFVFREYYRPDSAENQHSAPCWVRAVAPKCKLCEPD